MNTPVLQKDVICAVTQQRSGNTKTRFPHSHVSVRKTQEKRTQIMEEFIIFRTLNKLSLSPLIKASQETGMFFTKHWFTCGTSLENYVSQSPPLWCLVFSRQLFLQLNLPICSIYTILCFLFPDIKPQKSTCDCSRGKDIFNQGNLRIFNTHSHFPFPNSTVPPLLLLAEYREASAWIWGNMYTEESRPSFALKYAGSFLTNRKAAYLALAVETLNERGILNLLMSQKGWILTTCKAPSCSLILIARH